jgi:SAM-dependent methyltransferase
MTETNDSPQPYDDWADIYDKVYAYLDHDLPFYLEQAKATGGPVLELGSGTGRVALALAEAGFDVTGVDISPRMVEAARAKAQAAGLDGRARFVVGDMADAEAGGGFGLVCFPFRSFQCMLDVEDQRAALESAAALLRDDGLLALDLFAPDMEQLGDHRDEALPFHVRDVDQPDGGMVVVWGQNLWDNVSQINSARLIIEEVDAAGLMQRRLYRDFDLRYVFRYEMQHLLELSGFRVEAVYGDFEGGPVTESSEDLVWLARKAG